MRLVFMRCVLVTLLVNCAGSLGYAQDLLLPGDWPSQFRDSANTGNTPVVLGDNLKVLWEKPSPGGYLSPRLFLNRNGQHLVIAGNCIYEAHTGALLHYLPDAGDRAAITTTSDGSKDVLLTARPRDYLRNSGYEFFAYDLKTFERLWYLDSAVSLNFDRYIELNAKDGTFHISGSGTSDGVAAVDAGTGTVRWQKGGWDLGVNGSAAAEFDGADWVFMAQSRCGVIAFRDTGGDAEEMWPVPVDCDLSPPCVDQANGLVYFGARDGSDKLWAYHAETGVLKWSEPIDAMLNGAPTLGWAKDPDVTDGPVHQAVFVVTGGADGQTRVYAFDRSTGEELWTASVPGEAYVSAVYSGDSSSGKLYFAVNNYSTPDNDGSIYVFDVMTGVELQRLDAANFEDHPGQPCPVIAEVEGVHENGDRFTEGVLYFSNRNGNVAAWSPSGTNPLPPVLGLSLQPEVDPIAVNSSTNVLATLVDHNSGEPIAGAEVRLSCNAAKNQGYLSPTFYVYTDGYGVATTTFFSQSRTGTITVTATTRGSDPVTATTTISIVKTTGEEPPPPADTGSIQGTVYTAAGKRAKNATVELWGGVVKTTTTSAPGKYSFEGETFGDYVVFAFTDTEEGMTEVSISEEAPAVTSPEGDVYRE